jgi:erythrin-vacuolar iron transport family protein
MKTFDSLTEQEVLALAISLEEEDARIYEDFADGLQENYPEQAAKFREMRGMKRTATAIACWNFTRRASAITSRTSGGRTCAVSWIANPSGSCAARPEDRPENRRKHGSGNAPLLRGRLQTPHTDTGIRQLLGDLAEEERNHAHTAEQIAPPN